MQMNARTALFEIDRVAPEVLTVRLRVGRDGYKTLQKISMHLQDDELKGPGRRNFEEMGITPGKPREIVYVSGAGSVYTFCGLKSGPSG